ncbi:MAG: hypothetical protein FWE36_06005 [Erysipelotrichales bacterium]|nr:hypothetical protein [Erysipelotrichales bacterium]
MNLQNNVTRTQAITNIIESVALQETAISLVLDAESEKMQAIMNMPNVTPEQLLNLNSSVNQLISAIIRLEMMLKSKLELFSSEF